MSQVNRFSNMAKKLKLETDSKTQMQPIEASMLLGLHVTEKSETELNNIKNVHS